MSDEQYRCSLCRETFEEFNDCRSHVYHSHQEQTCGIAEHTPEMFVNYEIKTETTNHEARTRNT